MQLTDFGVRAGWLRGGRSWHWDELERIEGAHAVTRSGESLRLAASQRAEVAAVLDGPLLQGTVTDRAASLSAYCAGRFSAPTAARALLESAAALSASDLHLEPGPGGTQLRLRREGSLEDWLSFDPACSSRVVAALKGLAGCLPYRVDVVQEGRIPRAGVCADIRASFIPTGYGERVALRLFGRLRSLEEIAPEAQLADYRALLDASGGLVLVSGASGAGKTTTLYAMLAHVARRRGGAHLSLEDPVEQRLREAGILVDQVELDPSRGRSAEALLVAALRQDVDVLCVGEIRTAAEARLAIEAAHTGRLVLAGLHAGSAQEALQRMADLGVDAALLRTTLRGVVHQRLETVPCGCVESCPHCQGLGRRRRLTAAILHAAHEGEAR
jgi:type II secretory ATPase GspE/PulE/Tfp pilus assembly ATPase PilB-like protein